MAVRETLKIIKGLLQASKLQDCQNATLTIEEKNSKASLKSVRIVSVGAEAFLIKYDECGFPGTAMFAPHDSPHRACDAIAFCLVEGDPHILCCELKSSEPTRHEVAEQFRNAQCFLDYLDSVLGRYHHCSIKDWSRRYFVFHGQPGQPVPKRPTREDINNTSPERALFISAETGHRIYARQLLGKAL